MYTGCFTKHVHSFFCLQYRNYLNLIFGIFKYTYNDYILTFLRLLVQLKLSSCGGTHFFIFKLILFFLLKIVNQVIFLKILRH